MRGDVVERMPILTIFDPLVERGGLGVDLFFILSGFIISYNYLDRLGQRWRGRDALRFVQLRLARVYPVHLLTLATSLVLALGAAWLGFEHEANAANTPLAFLSNLLLVQTWFGQPYSWNGVAWSVSAEWFAYLLFPVAALALSRVRSSRTAITVAVAAWLTAVAAATLLSEGSQADRPDNPILRITLAFAIGCMAHEVFRRSRPGKRWALAVGSALLLIVALAWTPGMPSQVFLGPIAILILGLAHGHGVVAGALSSRIAVWGGAVSYSVYMVHAQVLQVWGALVLENAPRGTVETLAAVTLGLVLIIGAGAAVHRFVEEPSRRVIRSWRWSRRSEAPVS